MVAIAITRVSCPRTTEAFLLASTSQLRAGYVNSRQVFRDAPEGKASVDQGAVRMECSGDHIAKPFWLRVVYVGRARDHWLKTTMIRPSGETGVIGIEGHHRLDIGNPIISNSLIAI